MITSEQTDKLWPAIIRAKKQMQAPVKDSTNPAFRNKYAGLPATLDAIEVAQAEDLVTLQELTSDAAGVLVSTLIVHSSGQFVRFDPLFIPANKHDAQGFGSAATYGRRYALQAAWNLAAEDDDGNAAVTSKPQSSTTKPPQPISYLKWVKTIEKAAAAGVEKMREAFSAEGYDECRAYMRDWDEDRLTDLRDKAEAAARAAEKVVANG